MERQSVDEANAFKMPLDKSHTANRKLVAVAVAVDGDRLLTKPPHVRSYEHPRPIDALRDEIPATTSAGLHRRHGELMGPRAGVGPRRCRRRDPAGARCVAGRSDRLQSGVGDPACDMSSPGRSSGA
jgi:hypothetical protein